MDLDEVAHNESPHKDLHCLQIQLFSSLVYLDPNEMSGRSYFCTCPQTILLSEKENRICKLFTHR